MSDVLELQVHSLLSRMQAECDQACTRLREEATERSSRLVQEARHRARMRVKEAVAEKRLRVREHCRRVQAEVDAKQRDRRFVELTEQLARGLQLLPDVLAERWQVDEARAAWCRQVLEDAAAALGGGRWRIDLAPGTSPAERETLAHDAARLAGEAAEIFEDGGAQAGLRISRDGACYDGTVDGLLADRMRVQAALLAELGDEESAE
ncbi:MAG: hypothetical protein AMJ58_01010 [Gammaproteobacteria bacterium SG8_30]|jgi:hypothetical protein|nr:MAG: hypothetical protein AMJ58_01010 [Gammaproteobacteria bacterium SG8_30]